MKNIIEVKHITMIFPHPENPIVANKDVNLGVKEGEIHAIVGENGAGKSTLMNLLNGNFRPSEGSIFFKGKKVVIENAQKAISLGIGMVHQEFVLIPSFTIAENLTFGFEPTDKRGLVDLKKATQITRELSEANKLYVDPEIKVADCSLSMKQRVEILKVLFYGADLLIFDEPTAVLTPRETQELFNIFKQLIKNGKTIIFITHKLSEVVEIADRITVMRKGEIVTTVNKEDTTIQDLASKMVGRDIALVKRRMKTPDKFGEVILSIKDLTYQDDYGINVLKGINFSLRAGEILGIAGVGGNGQTELIECIMGLQNKSNVEKGNVYYKGKDISQQNSTTIRKLDIGYITGVREGKGVCGESSTYENLIMGIHRKKEWSNNVFLKHKDLIKLVDDFIEEYQITLSSKDNPIKNLSGGNVQKCIVAREMFIAKELIIAEEPTRGVDVGAIEFIHKRLIEKSQEGCGVMLVSTDLDEVVALSTRILVMYGGTISGEIDPESEGFEEKIGLLMAGIKEKGLNNVIRC